MWESYARTTASLALVVLGYFNLCDFGITLILMFIQRERVKAVVKLSANSTHASLMIIEGTISSLPS